MVCGDCCTTVICEPDLRLPAVFGLGAQSLDSSHHVGRWLWYSSPSCEVQEMFWAMLLSTDGNWVSALTLGSHVCLLTAWPARCRSGPCSAAASSWQRRSGRDRSRR